MAPVVVRRILNHALFILFIRYRQTRLSVCFLGQKQKIYFVVFMPQSHIKEVN